MWLECGEFEDKRKEMGQASRVDQIRKDFTGPVQEFGFYTEGNMELPQVLNSVVNRKSNTIKNELEDGENENEEDSEEGSLQKNCGNQGASGQE